MKTRTKVFLAAAAAAAAAVPPAGAEETLVVSRIDEPSIEAPFEPGSLDPLPGSDAWIAAQVTETFLSHRSAVAADAAVEVRNGVVVLRGQVVSEEYKALATAYAWEVPGVTGVDNRLAVAGTRISVRSTALDAMDDASITVRVKAALFFRPARGESAIKVKTKGGVVTLRGRVRSAEEKNRIEKLVAELDGVSGVNDRMTVVR